MSKGFLWFAQNNSDTDYTEISIELAKSIKKYNRKSEICVITDSKTQIKSSHIDIVKILENDESKEDKLKFSNEYKAFSLTPFVHTVKLEADMLFTSSTDWWWNHLCQHDMVFSINCKNYKDETIKHTPYRKLFVQNFLPNIYNGLFYFRKSQTSKKFFDICKTLSKNWTEVKQTFLINCHDEYPTTDVIYALALRIMDPSNKMLIDYPWFKFIHGKPGINYAEMASEQYNYLYPVRTDDRIYLGGQRLNRIWHYYEKNTKEILNARVF